MPRFRNNIGSTILTQLYHTKTVLNSIAIKSLHVVDSVLDQLNTSHSVHKSQ